MKWITLKTTSLAVAVCCLTFLGWYNWYIRHTFSELLPTVWYGGDWVILYLPPPWRTDFEQAYQSEMNRFYDFPQGSWSNSVFRKINGRFYVKNYYRFFDDNLPYHMYQAVAACVVTAEMKRSVGLPAPPMTDCTTYEYGNRLDELIWKYCPADKVCAYKSSDDFMKYSKKRRFYDNEDYIEWFGFGVEGEARGEYTWIGRLFSLFPDVDPESQFGDFIRSME